MVSRMVSMAGVRLPLTEGEPFVDPWRRHQDWTFEAGLPAHVTVGGNAAVGG